MFPYYGNSHRNYHHPQAFATSPHVHFDTPHRSAAPSPSPYQPDYHNATDLEEEERAALAHLRAIQRRREQARLTSERETQEHEYARLAARREFAAQVTAEREYLIAQKREQERARLAIKLQQERERERVAAIEREHERRRQFAIEYERRKAAAVAAAAHKARYEEWARRKAVQCARHCAAKAAHYAKAQAAQAKQQVKENTSKNEWDELNNVLGALFGINLVVEDDTAEKPVEKEVNEKTETKSEPVEKVSAPVDKTTETTPESTTETKKPEAATTQSDKSGFPEDLNSLLNDFLGLRVEPLGDKPAEGVANGVPRGLNEFLGQFGLQFEPEQPTDQTKKSEPAESSKKSTSTPNFAESSSAKAEAEAKTTPLTSFLNERTNLPPFVRDILENVEIAFKESHQEDKVEAPVEGKGKGVAPGERSANFTRPDVPTSTPSEDATVSSASSIDTLNSISSELSLVLDSFVFPTTLTFANETESSTPDLPFNRRNRSYHTQANKLLQLLLAADGVSSGGDKEVRARRKQVVRDVEGAIEDLEKKRDQVWQGVKERRERGEEVEEDDDVSTSSATSVVDHEEHHTRVEEAGGTKENEVTTETEGFVVPEVSVTVKPVETEAQAVDTEAQSTPVAVDSAEIEHKEVVEPAKEDKKDEKEEGYEIL